MSNEEFAGLCLDKYFKSHGFTHALKLPREIKTLVRPNPHQTWEQLEYELNQWELLTGVSYMWYVGSEDNKNPEARVISPLKIIVEDGKP